MIQRKASCAKLPANALLALCAFAGLVSTLSDLAYAQSNPVPLINQPLLPDAVAPGSPGFTLTVNGTGFVSGSRVLWNGHPRATQFASSSKLTASILASDLTRAATSVVTVKSPSSGGETSNPVYFTVTSSVSSLGFKRSTMSSGYSPGGIASGDFNGDGVLDLAFTQPKALGDLRLDVCLGKGDGTFQPCVGYITKPDPIAVIAADFNGDGKVDLATVDGGNDPTFYVSAVSILLGNGDGTFRAHQDSATAQGPLALATGDFNGDGKLDLAVALYNQNTGNQVSVLLGKGNGTFYAHVEYQTGAPPEAIVVGDFNGDGKLDLMTANNGSGNNGTVSVLLGNGDGTFQGHVDYPAGTIPLSGLAAGDFNADGVLDVAVVSQGDNTVSILLGNGDGSFQAPVSYAAGIGVDGVVLADFNADGPLDLAVGVGSAETVLFFLGNGDGTFGAPSSFAAGGVAGPMAVADFNDDSKLDLVAVDGGFRASVLLQASSQHLRAWHSDSVTP